MTSPVNWGELVAPLTSVHTPPSEVPGAPLPSQEQLLQWGEQIIEGIVKAVVKLVTGILLPGPAGEQLSEWAGGILDPVFGILGGSGGGLGDATNGWTNLLKLFNVADPTALTGDTGSFNPASILEGFVTGNLNPLGLLAQLNGSGFLPNSQRPQVVQDMIDGGWDIFNSGTPGSTIDNPISKFFESLTGIFGTGSSAQSQNVVQDSQISGLLTGGGSVGLSETFDGAAGALDTTNWEQTYFGSGSGSDGLSGSGKCHWSTSGAAVRGCLNRFKTVTTSDTQLVQVTTTSNVGLSFIGNHPAFRIQGRMNSTHDDYIEARITNGSAEIGYVVGGTYTRLGSAASVDSSSGTWTLKLGTTLSAREFVLLRNGSTVVSQTDGGAASQMGASYRYTGFSHVAGVQLFYIYFQMEPPDIESFGAADRLAAL